MFSKLEDAGPFMSNGLLQLWEQDAALSASVQRTFVLNWIITTHLLSFYWRAAVTEGKKKKKRNEMPGVSIPVFEKVFIEYVQLWQYNKVVPNEALCTSLSA